MCRSSPPIFLWACLVVGLLSCGAPGDAPRHDRPSASGTAEVVVEIRTVGDEMRYEPTEFTVRPGQQVRLVLENRATSPSMKHNVVILRDREAVTRVGMAAISAGPEKAFVPDDSAVLAFTPLAEPGETTEVVFTAPTEPGDYIYICTFPGHYLAMQGTMRAEAPQPL